MGSVGPLEPRPVLRFLAGHILDETNLKCGGLQEKPRSQSWVAWKGPKGPDLVIQKKIRRPAPKRINLGHDNGRGRGQGERPYVGRRQQKGQTKFHKEVRGKGKEGARRAPEELKKTAPSFCKEEGTLRLQQKWRRHLGP